MKKITFFFLLAMFSVCSYAQYATVEVGSRKEAYRDSLKNVNYKHIFPILGKGAYKKGIDIPYPFGVMPAYYYQRQNYNISGIQLGIDDSELQDIDFIEFGTVEGVTNAATVRPDIWIFPFLNLYGLIGYGTTITSVQVVKPDIKTTQHFHGVNFGVGATAAGAIGPVFISADANFNWVKFKQLTKPVPAMNLSMRFGHFFQFSDHPDRNIGVWAGPFYQNVQNDTEGEIKLSDVFGGDATSAMIDKINNWYDGLGPAEQKKVESKKDEMISELQTAGDHTIHYKLNKEVSQYWNLIVGFQYQHNKHWQFRTEMGTFGKRTQFLLTANYRFM